MKAPIRVKDRKNKINNITSAQRKSYKRICKCYGITPIEVYNWGHTLILQYPFITIGIEPDGYTLVIERQKGKAWDTTTML